MHPSSAEQFKRWARVPQIELRAGLLREQLTTRDSGDAVALLRDAHEMASLRDPDGQAVLLALGWALFDEGLVVRRIELGAEARRLGLHPIVEILDPSPLVDPQDRKRKVPDFGRGRPLTLGERKSLARTHDTHLIQRVVRDPHPDVVRILLGNPALREEDVVRICAIRPNDPEVLRAVYGHRRWIVRYRPRNAILRNPDCPLDVALLLAPLLRSSELREAAHASGLAPALRLSCRTILATRDSDKLPPD